MSYTRISKDDVIGVAIAYDNVLHAHGLLAPDHGLALTIGQPSAGIPWSIHVIDTNITKRQPRVDVRVPGVGSGVLGGTAREAYTLLVHLRALLNDMRDLAITKEESAK